jgi:hypothetical protein
VKSRAELIRAIKQAGLTIRVTEHWQPHLKGTTRTPKLYRNSGKRGIQSNGYYFDGVGHDGKLTEMWAEIPPASELRFNEDKTVTFHPNNEKSWTLTFEINGRTLDRCPY